MNECQNTTYAPRPKTRKNIDTKLPRRTSHTQHYFAEKQKWNGKNNVRKSRSPPRPIILLGNPSPKYKTKLGGPSRLRESSPPPPPFTGGTPHFSYLSPKKNIQKEGRVNQSVTSHQLIPRTNHEQDRSWGLSLVLCLALTQLAYRCLPAARGRVSFTASRFRVACRTNTGSRVFGHSTQLASLA